MSREGSMLGRYLKRRAALKVVATVGKAKLLGAAAVALLCFLLFLILLAALAGASSTAQSESGAANCTIKAGSDSPPPALVPIYQAAAQRYGLGPKGVGILAAINKVETDFGRSTMPGVHSGTNFAGAAGPMQFLLSTWEAYGVDGNGDGVRDVYDKTDAIFAAANYLSASGAPEDWYSAIFAYNHADWYVREVLEIARTFGEVECSAAPALGPVPSRPLQRIVYVARWIEAQRISYCWGGGHAAEPGPSSGSYCWNGMGEQAFGTSEKGLDCSGAVRWLLVLAGYPDPGPIVSGSFAGAYPSGPGRLVTIWSNSQHVFIEINGSDWGTASANYAHGPAFGDQSSAGFVASHPPGL